MKRQASSFYPHFNVEERPTIDYFVGLFNQVFFKNEPILTNFLNPREQQILQTIIGNELTVQFFGGFPSAEKKRALISSEELDSTNFEIATVQIVYNKKFNQIYHRDIYGAMNNQGISQASYGDIVVDENDNWYFFIKNDLLQQVELNLTKIGKVSIKLEELPDFSGITLVDDSEISKVLINSLRIDAVVAAVTKKSRGQVDQAIHDGEIKLNWNEISNSNIIVNIGDLISVRRFGRFKLENELGETKRGKHRIELKKWQTKKR